LAFCLAVCRSVELFEGREADRALPLAAVVIALVLVDDCAGEIELGAVTIVWDDALVIEAAAESTAVGAFGRCLTFSAAGASDHVVVVDIVIGVDINDCGAITCVGAAEPIVSRASFNAVVAGIAGCVNGFAAFTAGPAVAAKVSASPA
jgi:hypothetical protein